MTRPQQTRKSSLTFSVPSVLVTSSDSRPSLSVYEPPVGGAGSAGQISPLSLPRPPRCLTPYPDTLNFTHSHEPSPLSSPAFSASSLPGSDDEDVYDVDEETEAAAANPMSTMSPTTASKASQHHARLLAPALHMSHLNSPTDVTFRELPLSPMRKVQTGSVTPSPLVSPVYTTYDGLLAAPGDRCEKAVSTCEPVRLGLRRVATAAGEGVIAQRKTGFMPQEGRISVQLKDPACEYAKGNENESAGSTGRTAVPRARRGKAETVHELQVHVETVN